MFLFEHEHTKKLVGIKSFHHLQFSSINKGHVFAQETSEVKNLLKHKWTLTVTVLPECITPFGLSPTCQWHCFNKVSDRRVTEGRMPRLRVPDPSAAEYHLQYHLHHFYHHHHLHQCCHRNHSRSKRARSQKAKILWCL